MTFSIKLLTSVLLSKYHWDLCHLFRPKVPISLQSNLVLS